MYRLFGPPEFAALGCISGQPLLGLGGDPVLTPADVQPQDLHDCFGYRVLQESFDDPAFFQSVIDLCGSPELGCRPLLTPSPTDLISTSPIPIRSPSPPDHARVITSADYLDDEQLDEYMRQLSQEEGSRRAVLEEPGPSSSVKPVRRFVFVVC